MASYVIRFHGFRLVSGDSQTEFFAVLINWQSPYVPNGCLLRTLRGSEIDKLWKKCDFMWKYLMKSTICVRRIRHPVKQCDRMKNIYYSICTVRSTHTLPEQHSRMQKKEEKKQNKTKINARWALELPAYLYVREAPVLEQPQQQRNVI